MSVAVIIVGIDDWEKYTLPLLKSIKSYEPGLKIVFIDNGSGLNYPSVEGVTTVSTSIRVCYAEALNHGIMIAGNHDWYMLLNNDVIVKKPFMKRVDRLDPQKLHGFERHTFLDKIHYIQGWCFIISQQVIDKVGLFDEQYKPFWYDDVDYCIRAEEAGVEIQIHNPEGWGFEHLKPDEERNATRSRYMQRYIANRDNLKAKHGIE